MAAWKKITKAALQRMDDAVGVARELVYSVIQNPPSFSSRMDRVLTAHGELGLGNAVKFFDRMALTEQTLQAQVTIKMTKDVYKKVSRSRDRCEHVNEKGVKTTRRYACGKAGSFMTCALCERRWKFIGEAWVVYDKDAVEAGLLDKQGFPVVEAPPVSSKPSSRPPSRSAASSASRSEPTARPTETARLRTSTSRSFRQPRTAVDPPATRPQNVDISSDAESPTYSMDWA